MFLWIILACLTAAVAAVMLVTLARGQKTAEVPDRAGEIAVYRDQLAELERDRDQGLITSQEAEYANAEIGRRLIAAAGEAETETASRSGRSMSAVSVFVTLLVPVVGLSLYLSLGSPQLPDQPLAARLANPGNNMALLVAKAERHLAQNPQDGAGWDLLAPIYFRSMRLDDAELAYRNAIRLLGADAERLSGLGETLIAASDGIVTEDARLAFDESLRLQPDNPRARFYLALALEQAGRRDEARAAFEALAKDSPPGAPWMELVQQHIAATGGSAPSTAGQIPTGPSAEDVAAAQGLSSTDRQDMIRGMVEGLAARLEEDPQNLDGWLRLVRSYSVLGDKEKAAEALRTGLKTFPAEGDEGRRLIALAREVGLAVEGVSE